MSARPNLRLIKLEPPDVAGRPPPHDLDAEAAVIAASFMDPHRLDQARLHVSARDFYAAAHVRIFETMCRMRDAGEAIDASTVGARLAEDGHLGTVGGVAAIAALIGATPAATHVRDHAEIVARCARVRAALVLAHEIIAEGYAETGDRDEWLRSKAAAFERLAEQATHTAAEAIGASAVTLSEDVARSEAQGGVELTGPSSTIRALDAHTGGLPLGDTTLLSGGTGSGKTALAMAIALECGATGYSALYHSLEDDTHKCTMRAVTQLSKVPAMTIAKNQMSDFEREAFHAAIGELKRRAVNIDSGATLTLTGLRAKVRAAIATGARAGRPLRLVVVDYAQLLESEDEQRHRKHDAELLKDISRGLRKLALSTPDIAWLLLSQLNDDGRSAGSKQFEKDCALWLDVEQKRKTRQPFNDDLTHAAITIRKMRRGEWPKTIGAWFHGPSARFEDE